MWRTAVALFAAVVVGVAGGILLSRVEPDDDGADPAPEPTGPPLERSATLSTPAGSLSLRYPDGWATGGGRVNCGHAQELHVATAAVALESVTRRIGTGRACAPELDVRPLPASGAYVSLAYQEVTRCITAAPREPPPAIGSIPPGVADRMVLREFGVAAAYDRFDWRRTIWCASDDVAIRVEVFLGRSASERTRELARAVVASVGFEPG